MEVICLESPALQALIKRLVEELKVNNNISEDRWISGEEAMQKLRIKSSTTLLKLRQTGAIKFSQPEKKIILYHLPSIYEFLEQHAKQTF